MSSKNFQCFKLKILHLEIKTINLKNLFIQLSLAFSIHIQYTYIKYHTYIIGFRSRFLCRLPFWQRHIVLPVSQKTCHHQKCVFQGSYVLKYFIELKSVNPKNSVFLSLSLSIYISVIIFTFKFSLQAFVHVYVQVF